MVEKEAKPNDQPDPNRRQPDRDTDSPAVDGYTDDYLTAVAHDLRGSLNGIIGWAELIKRKALNQAGTTKAGETIIRQAKQQLDLINELVDTWRLLAGSLRLALKPVEARELISSALSAAQQASQREVRFESKLEPLPARLLVDAARLRQALTTLFLNALHFSPDGGVVHVQLRSAGGMAELIVQDGGAAISKEAQPFLFNRQRPQDSAKDCPRARFSRGLSIVRDLVDLQGGSISVESAGSSPGVTFRICLPLLDKDHPASEGTPLSAASVEGADTQSRLKGVSVLVVDDDPDAREVVAAILRHFGASVATAASAANALTILACQTVHVIVADIGMPVDDGYDLIRQIRAMDSQAVARIPAAALTAFTTREDRDRALGAGYQAHLPKPIDSALLVATVERLYPGSRLD